LLGSFNLTKYITEYQPAHYRFDWEQFKKDIPVVVRAQDNVVDNTVYPLPEQEQEAKNKRRMGLGYTGLANAGEVLGYTYGGEDFLKFQTKVHKILANESYRASAMLAKEKGAFPLFDKEKYLEGKFIKRLDKDVQELINNVGIRNSHLTSIAPTGTISLGADNVSGGCEPVFNHFYDRTIITDDGGQKVERVSDYGYRVWGVKGKTAGECTTDEHLGVLINATKWVDSAVSKTLNVGENVPWEEFKDIYMKAWKGGCKGATTYRAAGNRGGILNEVDEEDKGGACYIDPLTGKKSCD
jgi:ribonucleoside-diphosphate reductase alpha chain